MARNPLQTGDDSGNPLSLAPWQIGDPTDPMAVAGAQTGVAADPLAQWLARIKAQQQISADRGLWTGGQFWEGGHPTMAGVRDAIGQAGTAVALGTGGAPERPGFTAYHGSPHQFDAFDLSKIGTGEGAQAYGHGMYLADAEALAQYYRKKLAGPQADYDGEIDPAFKAALKGEDYLGFDTPGQAISAMRSHPDWAKRWDVENPDALASGLVAHDTAKYGGQGHMYEVNVNADPERFLHWDKPLGEQHPDVQAALEKTGQMDYARKYFEANARRFPNGPTGEDLHEFLKTAHGNNIRPAEILNEAGIPGIRYLDQGSRGAGEGTSNSVVFDPKNMEIIRRYGLAGLMAGGGAAAATQQQQPNALQAP